MSENASSRSNAHAAPGEKDRPLVTLADVHLKLDSQAGEVNILRGVNLTMRRGETVAIVGPSGSGKSTMMMVLAGLERATSGRVEVAGHDLGAMSEDALAVFRRDHVGIVFQSFHLVPTMTAIENVAIPLELAGRRDAFDRAREDLELVGLGHRLDHYPGQLSGGEQQRVAVARAFAAEPALLLADEPTGNLDTHTAETVFALLQRFNSTYGCAVLVVTHDPRLAANCRRTIELVDGQIVRDQRHTD